MHKETDKHTTEYLCSEKCCLLRELPHWERQRVHGLDCTDVAVALMNITTAVKSINE